MRSKIFLILISIFCFIQIQAQVSKSNEQKEKNIQGSTVMSEAYRSLRRFSHDDGKNSYLEVVVIIVTFRRHMSIPML